MTRVPRAVPLLDGGLRGERHRDGRPLRQRGAHLAGADGEFERLGMRIIVVNDG